MAPNYILDVPEEEIQRLFKADKNILSTEELKVLSDVIAKMVAPPIIVWRYRPSYLQAVLIAPFLRLVEVAVPDPVKKLCRRCFVSGCPYVLVFSHEGKFLKELDLPHSEKPNPRSQYLER